MARACNVTVRRVELGLGVRSPLERYDTREALYARNQILENFNFFTLRASGHRCD